jgi:hypothetical protein
VKLTLLCILSLLTLLTCALPAVAADGVSQATFLFLTLSPSAQVNARGFNLAAGSYEDPFGAVYNPGAIGFMAKQNRFSGGGSDMQWLPGFNLSGLHYRGFAANLRFASDTLPMFLGMRAPITYGLGAHTVYLDLGKTQQTDEQGHSLGSFHSWETASAVTFGAMMEHRVRVGFGISGQWAYSNLSPSGAGAESGTNHASAVMLDAGLIVEAPLLSLVAKPLADRVETWSRLRPELLAAYSYTQNNIGGKVSFNSNAPGDPLPRTAITSLGIGAELTYPLREIGPWKIFSVSASTQASDVLVKRHPNGASEYKLNPLGDIGFVHDIVLGGANGKIVRDYGYEIELLDLIYVRAGDHRDRLGNVFYHTSGFGFRLTGVFKAMTWGDPVFGSQSGVAAVLRHLDIEFDTSSWDIKLTSPNYNNPVNHTHTDMLTLRYK